MRRLALILPVLLASTSPAARAETAPRPETQRFACVGEGVYKVLFAKVYRISYCVQPTVAEGTIAAYVEKTHAGLAGDDLSRSLHADAGFYRALARAPGDKLVVLELLRDVSEGQIAKGLGRAMESLLAPDDIARLVAAVPGPARKGETIRIRSSGDRLVIQMGGRTRSIEDEEIAAAVREAWVAPEAIAPSLRASIAENVARSVSGTVPPEPDKHRSRSAFGARRPLP